MRSEIKFALFCCIVCTMILALSLSFQGGWLTILAIQYFGFPLSFLVAKIASLLDLDYPLISIFITTNINIFMITYILSKVYFSLKRAIRAKLSRTK